MTGTSEPVQPAQLARLEEHLGKRKPDGASALAEGRGRARAFVALARAWGERLDAAAGVRAEEQLTASALAQTLDAVAVVGPVLGAAAGALLSAAGLAAPAGRAAAVPARLPLPALRLCTSLHPDALRAALAGTTDGSTALFTETTEFANPPKTAPGPAFPAGPQEALPTLGPVRSAFAPEALRLVALRGIETAPLLLRAAGACEALLAAPPEENEALRLGALLAGLAARGSWSVTVAAAPALLPLARWLEALAALSPAGRLQLSVGEPLADPDAYGTDRLFVELRLLGTASDPRVRRLNAAGLPTLQLAVAPEALAEELVRWELALAFACGAPWLEGSAGREREHERLHQREDEQAPAGPRMAEPLPEEPLPEEPWLSEPALREGPLSIFCSPAHAQVLRKVAGTLGPKAAASAPHWLAAQAALQEPGELVSLHFTTLPTQALREALAGVQGALRDATGLAVRAVFGLGALSPGTGARAGGAAAGIYFLFSDLGGGDAGGAAGAAARREEERALGLLAAEGRRALLLRTSDEPAGLVTALLHAASLLKG